MTAAASLAGKHVLVIGINYWPEPTGIAPYTTDLAEHLATAAAGVTVVTGLPCYPEWRTQPGYARWRSEERRNGVRIIRLAHVVPRRQTALHRGAYEASFLVRAAWARLPDPVDIVVAVTPALGGVVAGAGVARRHGVPLVAHVQDLVGSAARQSGISGGTAVAGLTGRLEAWALRQAKTVAVVSDAMRPALTSYGVDGAQVTVLANWSHGGAARRDPAVVRRDLGWAPGRTVVLHTGNMGLKQDLGNVVEAARAATHRPDLLWVLMGDGSQRDQLVEQAAGLTNLVFLPTCDAADYADILAAADILLVNERPSVDDMSLPSKLTSYFLANRPVVAAVAAGGATARELQEGVAFVCAAGRPGELVEAVVTLEADPARRDALRTAGRNHAAQQHDRGRALQRLQALVSGALVAA